MWQEAKGMELKNRRKGREWNAGGCVSIVIEDFLIMKASGRAGLLNRCHLCLHMRCCAIETCRC